MSQPAPVMASNSSPQSSPRNPLCTNRRTAVPPARASIRYSNACDEPSSPGGSSMASRRPGSQATTVASSGSGAMSMNHPARPGPGAMARHTTPGGAGSGSARRISNSSGIGGLLGRGGVGHGRVDGQDQAVVATPGRPRVVVAGDQARDGGGQVAGEGGPGGR